MFKGCWTKKGVFWIEKIVFYRYLILLHINVQDISKLWNVGLLTDSSFIKKFTNIQTSEVL